MAGRELREFEEEMRLLGVKASNASGQRPPRPTTTSAGVSLGHPLAGGAAQPARATADSPVGAASRAERAVEAAAAAQLQPARAARQALEEEVSRLATTHTTLTDRLQAQESQLAEVSAALGDATARAAGLEAALAAATSAVAGAKEAARAAAQWRSALDAELRAAKSEREAADLRLLLRRRGLGDDELQLRALEALLRARPTATTAAVFSGDHEALRGELERIALVCDGADCQPAGKDTPVVRVGSMDCECCGGSEIRRAFGAFVSACLTAGVTRVTIVGGSPSYRDKLRSLSREQSKGLTLEVVQHERPGEGKRAQAVKGLVVIWGATEVDHSTTGHYRGAGDRTIAVNHRGIAGMLSQVSQKL